MNTEQITAYLDRIDVKGSSSVGVDYLQYLQTQHLQEVPFENLDIHWERPIQLTLAATFEKIVLRKRGGFCYELNGLFYQLLISLGFEACLISARVFEKAKSYSPSFDHMAIIVTIERQQYLVDVGFGAFCRQPIILQNGALVNDGQATYTVDRYYTFWRIAAGTGKQWQPEYIFQLQAHHWTAFEARSQYHQNNPQSHFAKGPVITRATAQGRLTLTARKFKGDKAEQDVSNEAAFEALLQQHFGIK